VVIVVPTLAHREQRQQPVVAGIVARDVSPGSANMRQRIDRKRRVINKHGTPEEADNEARPPGDKQTSEGERDSR